MIMMTGFIFDESSLKLTTISYLIDFDFFSFGVVFE